MRLFILFFIFIFSGAAACAQGTDSVVTQSSEKEPKTDSVARINRELNKKPDAHPFVTPKKTGLFSAILPGLGQLYNHQYWKIPIIYAGGGVAAYFISDNLKNYNDFRSVYIGRTNNDPDAFLKYPDYSYETVKGAMDYYRKYLDLSVLFTALGYTLQIMDAIVFAHLKNFDISPNISLHFRPVSMPGNGFGMGLVMNF
jgi:hypothetical protein